MDAAEQYLLAEVSVQIHVCVGKSALILPGGYGECACPQNAACCGAKPNKWGKKSAFWQFKDI